MNEAKTHQECELDDLDLETLDLLGTITEENWKQVCRTAGLSIVDFERELARAKVSAESGMGIRRQLESHDFELDYRAKEVIDEVFGREEIGAIGIPTLSGWKACLRQAPVFSSESEFFADSLSYLLQIEAPVHLTRTFFTFGLGKPSSSSRPFSLDVRGEVAVRLLDTDFDSASSSALSQIAKSFVAHPSELVRGLALTIIGNRFAHKGDLATACESYQKAVEESPDVPAPYLNAAHAWLDFGDYVKVHEWLLRGLEATQSPDLHFYQGLCFERESMHSEAVESWTKALAIDPNHPGALASLKERKKASK